MACLLFVSQASSKCLKCATWVKPLVYAETVHHLKASLLSAGKAWILPPLESAPSFG